jgi:ATP-binding protein involved in chromosome partitioning
VSSTHPTEETVLEALRKVRYPGFSRDIVSFGFVKDVAVGGGNVSFRLAMTTASAEVGEQIRAEADAALRSLPGVTAVTIRVETGQAPVNLAGAQAGKAGSLPGTRFMVAVASGKGGVGKSTVAANLALALRQLGYTVGLLDCDIYGPSQQMMMGIDEKPFLNEEEKIVPIERYGVRVMSIGFLMDVDTPVIWRGPMIYKAIEQFLGDVAWGNQDFLVVDLPPGTGDAQLTLTQKVALSGAVIVTTPQDVALIDARKGLAMFQKVNVPLIGLIENMSGYECPKCGHVEPIFKTGGGERTAEALNVPFLGRIPLDPRIALSGDAGMPIVAAEPDSASTAAFLELGKAVAKAVGA